MNKVLVVDDEPLVRASIQGLGDWPQYGYDLSDEARNGREALEQLDAGNHDIVLLDMNMPRCDGICFLNELDSRDRKPVVVVVSAFDEFSLVREAFTLGALDYLLKADITFEKVREVLDRATANVEWQDDRTAAEERPVDDRLRQQIMNDLFSSTRPEEFASLLEELGLALSFPCLPIQFRLDRENDTAVRFLRSSLESRATGLFVGVSGRVTVWLHIRQERGRLSIAEEAEMVSRELAELARQSLNISLEWAVGETVQDINGIPGAVSALEKLFSNTSRPVHRAKSFILSRYSDPELNLSMAAEYAGVSRTHLSALFAKELGMGFSDFLIQVRIDAAKELLAGSTRKVYEVAEEVGYGSVEQFSRMFKRLTGTTANRFQREKNVNQS